MGLFEAASFPCITSMLARWERGLYPNLNLREWFPGEKNATDTTGGLRRENVRL